MNKIWNLISSGTLLDHQSGKGARSRVKISENEEIVAPHLEPFGFSYSPPAKAEAFLISPGGNYEFTYSFLTVDRSGDKPDLGRGESAHYSKKNTYTKCKADGSIEQVSKGFEAKNRGEYKIKAKSFKFQNDSDELISLLTHILEAIDTASVAGPVKVTNPQLRPLIEKLKKFSE